MQSLMPLWKEVEYYKEYQTRQRNHLGKEKANEILREALHIISIGANDFLENYYLLPHRRLQFTVNEYERFLVGIAKEFVREIYELGARKVCLTALPPMGCLPLERTTNLGECIDGYNDVAVDFKGMLEGLVRNLNQQLSGIQMVLSSPYAIVYDIIQNPHSYGFEHSAKACCGTGRLEMSYLCNPKIPSPVPTQPSTCFGTLSTPPTLLTPLLLTMFSLIFCKFFTNSSIIYNYILSHALINFSSEFDTLTVL